MYKLFKIQYILLDLCVKIRGHCLVMVDQAARVTRPSVSPPPPLPTPIIFN